MDGSGGFSHNHLTSSPDKDGNGFHVRALFNYEHSFIGGSETDFFNGSSESQFGGTNFLESRDDSSSSCHGQKFNVLSSDPSNGREVVDQEQMVGLIIESPLTEGDVCSGVLNLFDHIDEVLLLLFL